MDTTILPDTLEKILGGEILDNAVTELLWSQEEAELLWSQEEACGEGFSLGDEFGPVE
jgi:hypothetical protein